MKEIYIIETLTPLFSYGANPEQPEIRAASIRGQLHNWFRLAGGTLAEEREIFGGIAISRDRSPTGEKLEDRAGKLVVRVRVLNDYTDVGDFATLPHKDAGPSPIKRAFAPGARFELHLLDRFGGHSENQQGVLKRIVDAWLLLGGLGGRANRGGGSLNCLNTDWRDSVDFWQERLGQIMKFQPSFKPLLHPEHYNHPETARKVITDTIGGPFSHGSRGDGLEDVNYPLGVVRNPRANPRAPKRKPSPLKLSVRYLDGKFRIVGIWDERQAVTGNTMEHRRRLKRMLLDAGKEIAHILPDE